MAVSAPPDITDVDVQNRSKSVDRAMAILQILTENGPQRLVDLNRELGAERRVLQRLLSSLERSGHVQRDPSNKRYDLGMTNVVMGAVASSRLDITRVAAEQLEALHHRTGHTTLLLTRRGAEAVSTLTRTPDAGLAMTWPVGNRMPLDVSCAKVILAYLQPSQRKSILAGDRLAAVEPALTQIRHDGYCVAVGEVLRGAAAVAAAVFVADDVVGALAVLAPETAFDPDATSRAVVDAARSMSHAISPGR